MGSVRQIGIVGEAAEAAQQAFILDARGMARAAVGFGSHRSLIAELLENTE